MFGLSSQLQTLERIQPMRITGRVHAIRGLTVIVRDLPVPVGSLVSIQPNGPATLTPARRSSTSPISDPNHTLAEVIGFDGPHAIVMPLTSVSGVRSGDAAVALHAQQTIGVGFSVLGRVLDGLGRPIDGKGALYATVPCPLDPEPTSALNRARITRKLVTGVRSLDLMTTLGRGQRLGIFAGPGVGKSTLLGTIAKNTEADVTVIALIGERGREVKDFIEETLGEEGLKKSVLVVATSDESALMRTRAALAACSIAEFFRDYGKSVLLIMDSITRFAHAQRQIGLSVGEPPATRGYTPSVFAAMARLLERAGCIMPERGGAEAGSITGLYSILVEGDDMTEPVADAARGILDGHVILSRKLAQRGHYPAIDVLDSISRIADDICDEQHVQARRQLIKLLAAYTQAEDLIQIGAYARGSNPTTDIAIRYRDQILDLLQQTKKDRPTFDDARKRLVTLALESGVEFQKLSQAKK